MPNIKQIYVHHTAVSHKINPDQWVATNNYHKQKWNFISSKGFYVGYNYMISANGTLRQAREDGEETAAQVGWNRELSCALDGNFDIELPTEAQIKTLTNFLKEKCKLYNIKPENILPHRAVANKSCFGHLLNDTWARDLIKEPNKPEENLKQQISLLQKLVELLRKLLSLKK